MSAMTDTSAERLAIRDIVENWVLWRDARQWDRFRTLWHAEGRMWATWFQGTFEEFIAVSQQGYEHSAHIHHMLGGTTIVFEGARAETHTKNENTQHNKNKSQKNNNTNKGRAY